MRLHWLACLWGSLLHITSGITFTNIDLESPVTHLVSTNFSDIYVGGENFIARLSLRLDLIFKLMIGPVNEPEHCKPMSAPCSNHVKVLEIDAAHNSLLVCGSAYQGTCTMHSLHAITEWSCVSEDPAQTASNVVATDPDKNVVAHFLSTTIADNLDTEISGESFYSCRSPDFGSFFFFSNRQADVKMSDVQTDESYPKNDGGILDQDGRSKISVDEDYNTTAEEGGGTAENPILAKFQSRVVIAGNGYAYNTVSSPPMLVSRRHLAHAGFQYKMAYARDLNSQPIGFDMQLDQRSDTYLDYRESFTWGDFSYFLAHQQQACANPTTEGQQCMTTTLSRVCNNPTSLLPLVEAGLFCEHAGKQYHLLTSATLATVGLKQSSTTVQVPVLVAAFGNGSDPMSTVADPKYGTAVCAFLLHTLDTYEFAFFLKTCSEGGHDLVNSATWVKGSPPMCIVDVLPEGQDGSCMNEPRNPYIRGFDIEQDKTALFFLPSVTVSTVLTHTQTLKTGHALTLAERMDVFLLEPSGIMKKFSLKVIKGRRYRILKPEDLTFYANLGQPKSPLGRNRKAGFTDHARAVMYVAHGDKVIALSLDFCRQHRTCSSCRDQAQCRWCADKEVCMDQDAADISCLTALEKRCPPKLIWFEPHSLPTFGGSILTIRGNHLGSQEDGVVNVTVCDEPCDDVNANVNSLTCRVRAQCSTCTNACNISVSVKGQRDGDGVASSYHLRDTRVLRYVVPSMTSFSPSFGPVSGGTRVVIHGEHLISGSNTTITIQDEPCDVTPDPYILQCFISKWPQRAVGCGPVQVTIDNYRLTAVDQDFCFRPDPLVDSVKPLATIESGGITVEVSGSRLDSVDTPLLVLTLGEEYKESNDSQFPVVFQSKCVPGASPKKLVCVTPDMRNVTKLNYRTLFRTRRHTTARLSLDMDGTDMLLPQPELTNMTVYRDPVLYALQEGSENARIHSGKTRSIIGGENIPTWLHPSDITVTVGFTRCKVIRVTPDQIEWDGSRALTRYGHDYTASTRIDPNVGADGDDDDKEGTKDSNDHYTENNVTDKNSTDDVSRRNESITTTAFPSDLQRDKNGIGEGAGSNATPMAILATPTNLSYSLTKPPHQTVRRETPATHTKSGSKTAGSRRGYTYVLKVKIGNYAKVLGNMEVGPYKKDTTGMDNMVLIGLYCGAGGMALLLVILLICVLVIRAKRKHRRRPHPFYMGSLSGKSGSQSGSKEATLPSLKEILESVIEPHKRADLDRLIVDVDQLTVGRSIGHGNFGCVYEGLLTSKDGQSSLKVAVKTLLDPSSHNLDLKSFVQEAVIMKDFQHPNVLGLAGLAEKELGIPYVILPFMPKGDLLTYVRDRTVNLSLHDVLRFGVDISDGMEYLSALKFVHRDLAARNCMLDEMLRVKVADFGLCRDIYEKGYYSSDNRKKLPIRWMAVESIEQGAYSTKTDVWSFGVVMWELLTRGVTPYAGVDGWDINNYLRKRRLAPPYFCPDPLYQMMITCWAKDPNLRPTFETIRMDFLLMIGKDPKDTPTTTPKPRRRGQITNVEAGRQNDQRSKQAAVSGQSTTPGSKPSSIAHPEGNSRDNIEKDTVCVNGDKQQSGMIRDQASNGEDRKPSASTVTDTMKKKLRNVIISFPACEGCRDVNRDAAAEYIQLVDNYEPPPKFANPLLRSKKRRSKTTGKRSSDKKTTNKKKVSPGYSVPGDERVPRDSVDRLSVPGASGAARNSAEYTVVTESCDGGSYYELETASRASINSYLDNRSSVQSSTGENHHSSMGSLSGSHSAEDRTVDSQYSSSLTASRASGVSGISGLNNTRHGTARSSATSYKVSPLAGDQLGTWYDESENVADEGYHVEMTSL